MNDSVAPMFVQIGWPLRNMHGRRLLPRDGWLLPLDGDGRAFVQLFRSTWRRLPWWARRRILHHWRSGLACIEGGPLVELSARWIFPPDPLPPEGHPLGNVTLGGQRLMFHASTFAAMPAETAATVIAHELAHVVQFSHGPGYVMGREEDDIEEEAEGLIGCWGFDRYVIDDWIDAERAAGRGVDCAGRHVTLSAKGGMTHERSHTGNESATDGGPRRAHRA